MTMQGATNQERRMQDAIRVGCNESDVHLACTYPDCGCRHMPIAIRAAVERWESNAEIVGKDAP
jgi:hypothetical protein